MQAVATAAQGLGFDSWIVNAYQSFADEGKLALAQNRLTGPIAACAPYRSNWPPTMEANVPSAIVYTKPMIVLIDDFSISAADIFPSMMQDNKRAPLVGMRTSGGGGSISGWPSGYYSESLATNTNSLVIRNHQIVTPDLPTAPFVENIGARPDIVLDFMTRDNLLTGGKAFVDQFTAILLDQINNKAN